MLKDTSFVHDFLPSHYEDSPAQRRWHLFGHTDLTISLPQQVARTPTQIKIYNNEDSHPHQRLRSNDSGRTYTSAASSAATSSIQTTRTTATMFLVLSRREWGSKYSVKSNIWLELTLLGTS